MVSFSIDPSNRPDLGFFTLLLKEQTEMLALIIVTLGLALTISTVDTLVNAISSLFVVDGKATFNLNKKTDYLRLSKYFIIFLSVIAFIVASKGYDVLYLFLLADLFCCAFVLTVFLSFYNKSIDEKTVTAIETFIDELNEKLPPLKDFVIPGINKSSTFAHQSRAICRRAERELFKLAEEKEINQQSLKYINRLSDAFFVIARTLARKEGEEKIWEHKK